MAKEFTAFRKKKKLDLLKIFHPPPEQLISIYKHLCC